MKENSSVFQLLNLDIKDKNNLLPIESIDVGFGAKAVLRKLKTTEKSLEREFRKSTRSFLIRLIAKLFEKCPLKYKMVIGLSSLSPTRISSVNPGILKKRFSRLFEHLQALGHVTTWSADNALKQYGKLVTNDDFINEAKKFKINKDRVDELYSRILDSPSHSDLLVVVRISLILSHGNARVECGFSINEESTSSQYEGIHCSVPKAGI